MKLNRWILVVVIAAIPFIGGCQCFNQWSRELKSQTVGLDREIHVYDYSGHLLAGWRSRTLIDTDTAGHSAFFDSAGRRVTVLGGILISTEEKP